MNTFRLALRRLRKRPDLTWPGVLILGLGLGTSTAMFSFVNGLLLRPIPLPGLTRLVTLWSVPVGEPAALGPASPAEVVAWGTQVKSLEQVAALENLAADLTGGAFPERIEGVSVYGPFFATLGQRPLRGRLFGEEAARAGNEDQVVISERLWRRRYGAAEDLVGQRIELNGRSRLVVGVLPIDIVYPMASDFWVPLALDGARRRDRTRRSLEVVARVARGASVAAAETELELVAAREARLVPLETPARSVRVIPLREHLLANSEAPGYLPVVLLAAGFLLALACANVANLQVAQVHGRLREFVVRAALGASRGRLMRQVLADSAMLGVLGGGAGLLVAEGTIRVIRGSLPPDLLAFVPGWSSVGLSSGVFAFAAVLSLVTGLAAGLAPALAIPQQNLEAVMREGTRGSTRSGAGARLRKGLVVAELALALVLLVACGVVVKTFAGLIGARRGFDTRNVLTMGIALPSSRYGTPDQITDFFDAAVRDLSALPGVRVVATASTLPFYSRRDAEYGPGPGRPESGRAWPRSALQAVSEDYFRGLQIPLLQGRAFGREDSRSGARVAIVSERIARECWPGESPLSRQLWLNPRSPDSSPITVVGVVADVRHDWRHDAQGTVYLPARQAPEGMMFVMLRTAGNPVHQVHAVRSALRNLDRHQPLLRLKPMRQVVVESMAGLHITGGVLTYIGLASLLVAAAGVYSVMASSVSQRTREMGIRSALGARRRDLLVLVLGEGMRLAVIGILAGLPLTLAVGFWLRHAIFGIVALHVGWIAVLAITLLAVAAQACFLPARRASRVDPIIVLRYE